VEYRLFYRTFNKATAQDFKIKILKNFKFVLPNQSLFPGTHCSMLIRL